MRVVALVCARGGSKGLPGKNLRLLGGKPLIAWAVEAASAVQRVTRVIVSTDADDIAAAARAAGADVPFARPGELARDDSAEWLVWRHALEHLKKADGAYPDALMVVPPTAPLRSPEDLNRCLDEFERGSCDVVITVSDAHRSPYFNMVQIGADGAARLVIPPDARVSRRQDAPPVYDMATVGYVARPEFVMRSEGIFAGRVRHVHVPAERSLDIDTELDFRIAECLLASR